MAGRDRREKGRRYLWRHHGRCDGLQGVMLNLRQIEALRAVILAGSLSGAARQLKVSQPALSRMLRRIEDVLQTRLFERGTGRLVATREALDIFAEIQKVYAQIDGLSTAITRIIRGETGQFRCGASPSLGRRIVPRALAQLHAAYPALELHLDILSLVQVTDYLLSGKGECVVTLFPVEISTLASIMLGQGELVAMLPANHPLASRSELDAEDLALEALISVEQDSPHGRTVDDLFRAAGLTYRIPTRVRFAETAAVLANEGLGIALVDEFTAMDPLPGLRTLPIRQAPRLGVYIHWNRDHPRSRQVAALEAAVRAALSQRTG
jgi:DNA-binding transcriptional LysR family regulator